MFIVDDILFRPFISILDAIHTLAVTEMYDIEGIQSDLKENQLLYELGERDESEYAKRKAELEAELETAELAHEQLDSKNIQIRQ
ncbi:gas vesicle protein GvpG [Halalkalicoccus sp. NIPERK01]|uniref:gas vesicle protein GvpG n=1 Tax=Halalkalicoccus sp. NIPERK01 TaxID=3053469 RepID=UPI00256EA713|nr:protein gvpG [Halalkalicoccus sp. NIPERK01]MDL5363702.1 protein gvpG [Halalkalicoccus sp. NIPERK01]